MLVHLSFWVHAKAADKTKDGRLAYRRIYQQIFGVNALAIRDAACDSNIRDLEYTGDQNNFNWDWYTNLHVKQHNVKSSLVTHGFTDYIDDQKFRYLIDGIKTANLETCIQTITTNDDLRENFGCAACHIMDFLVRQKAPNPNRNISGVNTGRGGYGFKSGRGGNGGGRGTQGGRGEGDTGGSRSGIPPQADVDKCSHITRGYYPGATYAKFNAAERQKVYQNKKKY